MSTLASSAPRNRGGNAEQQPPAPSICRSSVVRGTGPALARDPHTRLGIPPRPGTPRSSRTPVLVCSPGARPGLLMLAWDPALDSDATPTHLRKTHGTPHSTQTPRTPEENDEPPPSR
eukprot:361211-Chlamydomonas_euryale.AAC.2